MEAENFLQVDVIVVSPAVPTLGCLSLTFLLLLLQCVELFDQELLQTVSLRRLRTFATRGPRSRWSSLGVRHLLTGIAL